MDRCRYKTLLRDSAKLKSNSQYTNQNTAYLPLDVYTCYDYFQPPSFTMSGATKITGRQYYEYSASPYTTLGMSTLGEGPTGATQNSVWNLSNSATTLEYYFPYEKMSGYTGKFRSTVYKYEDAKSGFVYPPVHTRFFDSFPLTADLSCEGETTASTFSAFFSISATSSTALFPNIYQLKWYWFGQDITRSDGAGGHLEPTWDGLYTAYTLTNNFNGVFITTGGTFGGATTGETFNFTRVYKKATKNGHIIPIDSTNVTNAGVTGNAGYWQNGDCYVTGATFSMAIGAGRNGPTGLLNLSGGPTLISSSGGSHHGFYSGFVTGNVSVFTACCASKVIDIVPINSLATNRGEGSAMNSNNYLVKGSFVYSGDGGTEACYLTSGNTYDTLIDNPDDPNFEGAKSTFYRNQSIFYLSEDPIGDITLSINGVVLENNIEFIQDKREIQIKVTEKGGSDIDIKTTDNLVAAYVMGEGVRGLVTEGATVTSGGVDSGDTTTLNQNILYSKFNYNTGTTNYEYYTNQPLNDNKQSDLSNLIVLINGVRLKPNSDFYRGKSSNRLIIFNKDITLSTNDKVNLFYLTNLQGVENTTLTSQYKKVSWTVSPPPNTSQGYFDVEVTSSADTGFLSATTYQTVNYEDGMGRYETNIGPFITLNQKYLYRVVNTRSYLGISGSNVTTTATSRINKFDTDSPSLLRY